MSHSFTASGLSRITRPQPWFFLVLLIGAGGCKGGIVEDTYTVTASLPHDGTAYTQGLLLYDGFLYESTGRYGHSELRKVDIATGAVLQRHALRDSLFGEGLALVEDRLIQLTWKAGLALVYDLETLTVSDTLRYEGEGWGLCYDGRHLIMSNGSGDLIRRDPTTFAALDTIRITRNGFSTRNLNELECVGDQIFANVYMTDEIYRIDKNTGNVVGELDGYGLSLASSRPSDPAAVLNGIAHDPSDGSFIVTGKLWGAAFRISIDGQN